MQIRGFVVGVVAFISAFQAFAYESRFGIDPTADLATLTRTGELKLTVNRQDKLVSVDGSAVVKVDPARFIAVVRQFERYQEFGVTAIRESHIVDQGPGDLVYVWNNVQAAGRESKQYLEFRLEPVLTNTRAAGMEWQMVDRRSNWTYPVASQFASIEGSWYLEPLADGALYVRYFQKAKIESRLPGWLIDRVVRSVLIDDSKAAYEAFVRAARAE